MTDPTRRPCLHHMADATHVAHVVESATDLDLMRHAAEIIGALERLGAARGTDPAAVHVATGKPETRAPTGDDVDLADRWRRRLAQAAADGDGSLGGRILDAWGEWDRHVRGPHAPTAALRTADDDRAPIDGDRLDELILCDWEGLEPWQVALRARACRRPVTPRHVEQLRRANDRHPIDGRPVQPRASRLADVATLRAADPRATPTVVQGRLVRHGHRVHLSTVRRDFATLDARAAAA